MFDAVKIAGINYVGDHRGNIVIGYKNRIHAEQYARGATFEIFTAAEIENERRDRIAAYLAKRANRVYVPNAQLELL